MCLSAIEEVDVRVIELSECVMHPTVIMSTRPDNPVFIFSVSVVVSCFVRRAHVQTGQAADLSLSLFSEVRLQVHPQD